MVKNLSERLSPKTASHCHSFDTLELLYGLLERKLSGYFKMGGRSFVGEQIENQLKKSSDLFVGKRGLKYFGPHSLEKM